MVSQTNESALNTHIAPSLAKDVSRIGNPADFDTEFAMDGKLFWKCLETDQPRKLAKPKGGPDWRHLRLKWLNTKTKNYSQLAVREVHND